MADLAPDELLVEVEATVLGRPELAPSGGVPAGGAAVGRVLATGDAATRLDGLRVLVGPIWACGECDACRRSKLLACPRVRVLGRDVPGTLAGTVRAPSRWACPLDGALDGAVPGPRAAVLPREALALYTLHARLGLGPGDPVVWLGDGPMSRLGAALAAAAGAVVVPTTLAPGRTMADVVSSVDAELERLGARRVAWTVLEATGAPDARLGAIELAATGGGGGGSAGFLAGPALGVDGGAVTGGARPAADRLTAALGAEVRVLGVAAPHPDLLPELVALVHKGVLSLDEHVDVVPWADQGAKLAALARQPADTLVVLAREPTAPLA